MTVASLANSQAGALKCAKSYCPPFLSVWQTLHCRKSHPSIRNPTIIIVWMEIVHLLLLLLLLLLLYPTAKAAVE